ncbi:RNA polymerase II C-terminal domain phosphatase-like 3 [Prosopis cineraria]|uniref:RNA polymerase II C-terminal domain phosphatase-like 3 n=1 Tax=Prosopis cineraria TaxID=364024 RepID=UPI00240F7FBF|nr:RNA polymerase II C-terminal domain phosphatase-like 3 [Prosopis cineraria]
MVSGASNFVKWNNLKEIQGPVKMAKDHNPKVEDVEEGEISDTASVEEITEEDFNNQDPNLTKRKRDARVWAVRDLYTKYPSICRGYASGLYNLAWAQAVQNKPLNDIFVMDLDSNHNSNRSSSPSLNAKENSNPKEKEVGNNLTDGRVEVVDVDKEDGELEEGEIDMDAEFAEKTETLKFDEATDGHSMESDRQVTARQVIENITMANAEKSFAETCCQLQNAFQSLMELSSATIVSQKDALIQTSLNAIKVVHSAFFSMNNSEREQNKDGLIRLLSFVKNQGPFIFSPDHMEEIQSMVTSLDSIDCSKEKELLSDEVRDEEVLALCASSESVSFGKPSDTVVPGTLVNGNAFEVPEVLKSAQSNVKGRGALLPLLDLHKDHDVDSLPSPTREAPSCFPVNKKFSVSEEFVKPNLLSSEIEQESEDSKLHHYETDALRAVSTYQQKFGGSSFLMNDKLPSPTPSDNGDDGVVDTNEEVSSASRAGSLRTLKPSLLVPTSSTSVDRSSMYGLVTSRNDVITTSGSHPVKSSAKSRDPRLRFINSDASSVDLNRHPVIHNSTKVDNFGTVTSKKQKAVEAPCLDVAVKRQKNEMENPGGDTREVRIAAGIGGRLEETSTAGSQLMNKNQLSEHVETETKMITSALLSPSTGSGTFNVTSNATNNGNEMAPISNVTASLPALLKGLAVNPSILLNILVGQQRLAAEATQKYADSATTALHPPSTSSIVGADSIVAVGPSKTAGLLQNSSGVPLASSQLTSTVPNLQEDSARIHMKPRDPRRILHGNTLQKSGSMGSEQLKATVPSASNMQGIGDNGNAPQLEGWADTKLVPSQTVAPPDIARQFTRNLKNIADIISVSQTPSSHSTVSQSFSSAAGSLESDRLELKSVVSNPENLRTGPGSAAEPDTAGSSQPPSTWGDVEHLFVGYDEQQKAAIQRERARRIEEQKKMFAARKLCLVLDLDHTLLNSAKFVEVDPVHDEILRKKEEQDREKAQRHLFRFPHMGMWTKLRPGIWNFLEKASKLFELHLYTMGNKLYATQMAKVLDPKGVLFAGRVISRGDDTDLFDGDERVPKSKDLEGVLGMESAVVIIDDSVKVWPHNKLNLIVVERYTYFPCSRRQFGLPGPSLLEIDHDERPEDGTLASSLAVIERIHQIFFASQSLEEADVRNILASEQRRILAGCRIVFSRVFPVGEANPHLHPLWQTAEQFGAVCTNQIDDQVTHVVANSLGTDKVNWAISNGRFVVHPGWVEASALLYRRANEQDFSIKP